MLLVVVNGCKGTTTTANRFAVEDVGVRKAGARHSRVANGVLDNRERRAPVFLT